MVLSNRIITGQSELDLYLPVVQNGNGSFSLASDNGMPIKMADSMSQDSFGRLRVSNPQPIFDSTTQYDKQPFLWNEITTGAGTSSVHVPADSGVRLSVTANTAGSIKRQSKEYFRYQPGISKISMLSGVIGSGKAGITKRIGNFDDDNGIYFEITETGAAVVRRKGGVDVEKITQDNWNVDKLDGTGLSGFNFNPDKANIQFIDFEWLGVGRVRIGVVAGGTFITAHEFLNENQFDNAYITTANLPIRYEIVADGTNTENDSFLTICSTVLQEGSYDSSFGFVFNASNETTLKSVSSTAYVPVISIRPKKTFNSITNRGAIFLQQVSGFSENQPVHVKLQYGGTLSSTGAWISADDDSIVEYNIAGTSSTGGHAIESFYIAASTTVGNSRAPQSLNQSLSSKLPITIGATGGDDIEITVLCRAIDVTADVGFEIGWREQR